MQPVDHCYICKLGWLPDEETPKLVCHEGLWYCEPCNEVIQERIRKNSAWGAPTIHME